ncbi:hypothetical protein [Streptomyces sp. AC550_RSS872]|uniref:hypothetical protein n=1 Tax=Streptomyces sp. AC550_RSS872 TaxID=2823689 RepID=UPI001C26C5D1|nr:hypothetical protein [Streptomyces sp. AC550_RSS872]
MPGEGIVVLAFTSSKKTEPTNLSLIHRSMAEILESGDVTAEQWHSAALRVKTRMMTGDSLARRSPWHRFPYDAQLVDPLSWAQQNPPELDACRRLLVTFVHEISEHRAAEANTQYRADRVDGCHEHK